MIHTCGAVGGFRLVLDDYGEPAIIRWCQQCNAAIYDAPPIDVDEVPADLLAVFIATAHNDDKGKPQ